MPYFSNDNKFTAVPTEFIKKQLPQANPTFVKIYLYLLMLASENTSMEFSDIAETLGLLESDLMLAVKYWKTAGVIREDGDRLVFGGKPSGSPVSQDDDLPQKKPHHENLASIIESDRSLSDMFMVSQEILGKTISGSDMETIYWFYSELKMSPEAILLLLEHCVSKGKTRMNYIEKVAMSWSEMGLTNAENVALYIKNEEQKTGFIYSIRKIMGISDRSLSQIEEKYLIKWHNEMEMDEEMIALAYEYCIIQTAKLSFPYMDKIITRWKKEGIRTVRDAEEDNRKFKKRSKSQENAFGDNAYDHDDLELLTRG